MPSRWSNPCYSAEMAERIPRRPSHVARIELNEMDCPLGRSLEGTPMKRHARFLLLMLPLGLGACGGASAAHPKSTPAVAHRSIPTSTPRPAPTRPPIPTATLRPTAAPPPTFTPVPLPPTPPVAPPPLPSNGIPQNNGGDGDADNNGGPTDGDGNI